MWAKCVENGSIKATSEKLSSGNFGSVFVVTRSKDGKKRAVKKINKTIAGGNAVQMEIEAMKKIKHRNVARMYEHSESECAFYIVMDYMSGGDMFEWIMHEDPDEDTIRDAVRQIVHGVRAIHAAGFVHRDLKMENVLTEARPNGMRMKIADFGLVGRGTSLTEMCGSLEYAAPELLKHDQYDQKVDMWSLGVLCYVALFQQYPFDARATMVIYAKIVERDFEWGDNPTTVAAKVFIEMLLSKDPKKRPTPSAALKHLWFHPERKD